MADYLTDLKRSLDYDEERDCSIDSLIAYKDSLEDLVYNIDTLIRDGEDVVSYLKSVGVGQDYPDDPSS